MKKGDIILTVLLLALSFLPYAYFSFKDKTSCEVYIMVEGKPYQTVPLTGQFNQKEMKIVTSNGYNIVKIENEGVSVIDSNCHDHICEDFGEKRQIGDVIVCLPHKLYIEVRER